MSLVRESTQNPFPSTLSWRKVCCTVLDGSPLEVSVSDVITGYAFRVELEQFSLLVPCSEALRLCLEGRLDTMLEMHTWVELERQSIRS